jgi:hypothetical protein
VLLRLYCLRPARDTGRETSSKRHWKGRGSHAQPRVGRARQPAPAHRPWLADGPPLSRADPLCRCPLRQVEEAARAACIHDTIVQRFPLKYDTVVGERGLRLRWVLRGRAARCWGAAVGGGCELGGRTREVALLGARVTLPSAEQSQASLGPRMPSASCCAVCSWLARVVRACAVLPLPARPAPPPPPQPGPPPRSSRPSQRRREAACCVCARNPEEPAGPDSG